MNVFRTMNRLPSLARRIGETADRLSVAFFLALLLLGLVLVGAPHAHAAGAPAGAVIGNQASATYSDASLVTRTVTSNTVVTTVQQVASLTFAPNGTKTVTPGGIVYFPHTLTNTGNGTDSFALGATQAGTFTHSALQFFADANGDGVPDNATPITTTGPVPAGGAVNVVLAGTVPSTAVAGNVNTATLTATSAFNAGVSATATDVATITTNAVVQVTQALDVVSGPSPSAGRTVTLTYTNTGNATATNVVLTSTVPSGFTYVANSARWSVTGAGTTLTDANAADAQSGIVYDYNVSGTRRVTATVASVPAGVTGTVTFQVDVAAGLAPGVGPATTETATFAFHDGVGTIAANGVNAVAYTVTQSAGLTVTGATVAAVPQGGTVSFLDTVTNTGNGTDTFLLKTGTSTFPAGTTFVLYRADGVTPLTGSTPSGQPDTGPLAGGASIPVVVKAILPPGAGGGPYTVALVGTSAADASRTAQGVNTLTAVTGNSVDLVNDTAVPGASGVGPGPEASPVFTQSTNPGTTVRYALVVSNGSSVADAFDLAAAGDAAFATGLPAGWTVTFRDASGATLTNTGVLAAGASRTVYADVAVPTTAAAGTSQVYFRALSAATGSGDRLHDAVTVNTVRSLVLAPNGTGQAAPGGTVVYRHVLTNSGNVVEGDGVGSAGALATADSLPGFNSVVHWDRNNDGVLDAGDPVVTSLAALVGGTNGASTAAGLNPGESVTLFVKVTAPASAQPGIASATTLTVTVTGVLSGVVAPAPAVASDQTTVVGSTLVILLTQSLDADCNGVSDSGVFATTAINGVLPGACIRYTITATNSGSSPITGLVVSDATPANTAYHATVPAATSIGTVTAPAAGASGTVQATVGTLAAGQSVVVTFGVRIAN
jgi:uncharacterized repeat protein (TIGR01451 family)